MKKIILKYQAVSLLIILLNIFGIKVLSQPVIVDHTCVNKYQDIPDYYINEVKKMWITIPGESHSVAYRTGCSLLEGIDSRFDVNVIDGGTPESYTDQHLRISRATWGDVSNASGWIYFYGEEDWFTSALAISRTKDGITYCNTHSLYIAAMGFAWCWDAGISFPDYISATDDYVAYCESMGYPTKALYTTGTVDNATGETGYIKHLGYESIRDHVESSTDLVLFDYADILCYNDDGSTNTTIWNGHTYPIVTATNLGDGSVGHIGPAGALRLGKAIWYMLARIAGWNGLPEGDDTEAPTVPTNLQGTSLSVSSAQLSWTASTDNIGVSGYRIYRNGALVNSTTVTSLTDNALSVGNSYSYTVSAFDAAGNVSSQSTPVIVSTNDIWAPSVPTNLQGNALSVTSTQFSWNASTDNVGVTGYRIYRNGALINTTALTTFTDNGLSVGNSYSYTVSAFDAAGNVSSQSAQVIVSTNDIWVPSVPTNLQGTALSVTSAQLSWTASTDNVGVSGYRIYRNGALINTTAFTTFTDNGLSIGNSYSYTVSAFDAAGNISIQSTPVVVSTNDIWAPSMPSNLQAIVLSVTSAQLSWTASTDNVGVTGYRIYRDAMLIGLSATTAFTDNGLSAGNTYSYNVTAIDAASNEGSSSVSVNVNTNDTEAPTAPTNLQAAVLSVTSAQLSWTTSIDNVEVSGYRIYRDGTFIDSTTATTFTDNGLSVANTYNYFVTAVDAATNESNPSSSINVTINDTEAPTIPYDLQAVVLSITSARLSWTASTDNIGVTGYRIFRDGIFINSSSATSYTDHGLTAGLTYSYSITAYDSSDNESSHSQSVKLNTNDTEAPAKPTNFRGITLNETTVLLTWDASTDNLEVTGYKIYRDKVLINTIQTLSYTDNGLKVSKSYNYYITAYDAAGNESTHTQTETVKTYDLQAPSKPVNLQGIALTGTSARLIWDPSTDNIGVTGYFVYRDGKIIDSCSTTNYIDYQLNVGKTYTYFITAFDAAGNESGHSQTIIISTTDTQAPTVPKNLKGATLIDTRSAQLSWDPSTDDVGVEGYRIYRDKTIIDSCSSTSYTDNGLIVDYLYTYTVTAYDAASNESNHSQPVLEITITGIPNVFTPNGDGINETWAIPFIENYPDAVIRIFDRNLKQIIQYTGLDSEWDGRDSYGTPLPTGAYLYIIELNNGMKPVKGYVSIVI